MILTRPTPDGYQHLLELKLQLAPAPRFTDPDRALNDLATGLTQPIVEVLEHHSGPGVAVRLGVFSDGQEPSVTEIAALQGLAAELRFEDSFR